ncbi:unnamed protein product, partial [Didymodactylos carnosus]
SVHVKMARVQKDILDLINSAQVHNRQIIRNDIIEVLEHSLSHLSLKLSPYCVRYNIPVELWIPHDYPYSAPMCYVKPTPHMDLAVNTHVVDQNGAIHIPYLENWNQVSNKSNLVDLITQMSLAFGKQSPVYAKRFSLPQVQSSACYTNNSDSCTSNKSTNSDSSSNNKCIICLNADIDCVVLECGHMMCCLNCSKSFQKCPICRQQVQRVKRIYKS